jgi:hypothetical protein
MCAVEETWGSWQRCLETVRRSLAVEGVDQTWMLGTLRIGGSYLVSLSTLAKRATAGAARKELLPTSVRQTM